MMTLYEQTKVVVAQVRELKKALRQVCDLTPTQVSVLMAIADEAGPRKINHFYDVLQAAPSSLTPLLDALERHGLVKRERSSSDRRAVYIHITDAGLDLVERLKAGRYEPVA